MADDPVEVSLIASVYNEEDNLTSLVHRTVAAMGRYPSVDAWEFLLIDDASTDGSRAVLESLRDHFPYWVQVLSHPERRGQKGCFMTGFAAARGRIAVLMDADLQVLPEELPQVLNEALLRQQEMVCTCNDLTRGGKRRHPVSQLGNVLMRWIFHSPVRDAGGNFMAVETRFLRGVRLTANDQRYLLPIAMRRGLTRIAEVGCIFGLRAYGQPKYSYVKKTLTGVPEMLALRRRLRAGTYDAPPVPPPEPSAARLVTTLRPVTRDEVAAARPSRWVGPHDQLWGMVRGGTVLAAAGWRPEPWDSQALGLSCGRCVIGWSDGGYAAQLRRLTKLLSAIVEDARQHGVRFLSLRVPEPDLASVHAAESVGFNLIESYVTLSRPAGPVPAADPCIRPARPDDRDVLAELAARTFRNHRYLADPHLPADRARHTRRQWVQDAFAGRADAIYVAEVEGRPAGFVILRSRAGDQGAPMGVIDLLAVNDAAAGRGLGRALAGQAIREASGRGMPVEVGTQGKNAAALGLYATLGFSPVRTEWTLHWHAGLQPATEPVPPLARPRLSATAAVPLSLVEGDRPA